MPTRLRRAVTYCRSGFTRMFTIIVTLALVCASLYSWFLVPSADAQQKGQPGQVYELSVAGTIELGIAPFIKRSLQEAEAARASAVILHINTLGGRVDAALQIVDAVSDTKIPVYAFIHPRAISAGALIAVSADSVFMTPDALFGASTVVGQTGEKVSEKAQSMMRAQYRALAERRGIDPRVGEAMVDENIAVPGLTEKGQLLTLTTQEAERVGYAFEARSIEEVLDVVGLSGAEIVYGELNWAEQLVRFLTSPIVSTLLLPIGMVALIAELKSPSFGVIGAIGIVALALFFGSHMLVGLAGWEEVILLLLGFILLGLEIFVIPGFGIVGILGLASILASIFLALLGDYHSSRDLSRATNVVAIASVLTVVALVLLVRYLPKRTNTFGIFLTTATTADAGFVSGQPRTDLLNAEGVALTDLRPTGTAQFGDERLDVVSEAGFLAKGQRLRLVHAEPYRNVVLPVVLPVDDGAMA